MIPFYSIHVYMDMYTCIYDITNTGDSMKEVQKAPVCILYKTCLNY